MCAHVARIAPQYLDSLLYQHTTDRAFRDRFVAGGGFCGRHVRATMRADTAGNGDGVGGGIFLRSQLAARRRALEDASGLRTVRRIRAATMPAWDCPVCENSPRWRVPPTGESSSWPFGPAWETATASAAWCLTHLGELLAAAAAVGRGSLVGLRDRQLELMRDIEARLEALAHDSSHGRRRSAHSAGASGGRRGGRAPRRRPRRRPGAIALSRWGLAAMNSRSVG